MRIYCFSGLGVDHRIFQYLDLNHDYEVIKWISPFKKENLENYTKRLSAQIDTTEDVIFIGVSFGGIVAQEMSKIITPRKVILISSLCKTTELPAYYQLGKLILPLIPNAFTSPPFFIIKYLFNATEKNNISLLKAIMYDTDPVFVKWAMLQILNWKGCKIEIDKICIHGTNDRILRVPAQCNFKIENTGHFAVVDKAVEISKIINHTLEKA